MIVVFITVLGSCPRMREGLEEGWMQERQGKEERKGRKGGMSQAWGLRGVL